MFPIQIFLIFLTIQILIYYLHYEYIQYTQYTDKNYFLLCTYSRYSFTTTYLYKYMLYILYIFLQKKEPPNISLRAIILKFLFYHQKP